MRVVLVALLVVGAMAAALALLEGVDIDRAPWAIVIGFALLILAVSIVALVLLKPWRADDGGTTAERLLRRLEGEGLLASSDFRARRAFGVRGSDDQGPHYFLELADGRVLYLSGEYLYDYGPTDEAPGLGQPRRFPCTDFTVRTHQVDGYVVGLVCRGTVLEPEFMAPPFSERTRRSVGDPEDGQVLSDRPYDRLKELVLGDTAEPNASPDRGGDE